MGLVTAFLQLLVDDAVSDHPILHDEAWQFLEDRMAVNFWCSLAGIDAVVFQEHVHQLQRARGPG
jgi:hypothetical protein